MKKLLVLFLVVAACLAIPGVALAAEPNSIVIAGRDAEVTAGMQVESVIVFGGDAQIAGRVTETVVAVGGNVVLQPGAEVFGDVVSVGGTIQLQGNARIGGQQISLGNFSLKDVDFTHAQFLGRKLKFAFSIWSLLSVLFLGMILNWLLPLHVQRSSATILHDPLRSVLYGLLGYLALIPLTIALFLTILGIPLVPVFWLFVAIARLLGQVALAKLAGERLAPKLNLQISPMMQLLLGLLALGLVTAIPIVGGLAGMFYGLIGFGAVIWTRFGTRTVPTAPVE